MIDKRLQDGLDGSAPQFRVLQVAAIMPGCSERRADFLIWSPVPKGTSRRR
jgi:hypothetical protein